jgi:hypothetical protein
MGACAQSRPYNAMDAEIVTETTYILSVLLGSTLERVFGFNQVTGRARWNGSCLVSSESPISLYYAFMSWNKRERRGSI